MNSVTLLTVALVASAAHARYLTDLELQQQECVSSAYQIVSRVRISNVPRGPTDILVVPDAVDKYRIECLQVFDSLTYPARLSTSQLESCQAAGAQYHLCEALAGADPPSWTCRELVEFQRRPRNTIILGEHGQAAKRYKIQWTTTLTAPQCFPRDLTVQFVGLPIQQQGAQLGASVVFIIIVVVFGVLFALFGFYQIHKAVNKFQKADLMDGPGAGVPPDDQAAIEGYENGGADGVERPDIYGERDDDPHANQYVKETVLDDNSVLQSKPLPTPWYKRRNYNLAAEPAVEAIDDSAAAATYASGRADDRHAEYRARQQRDFAARTGRDDFGAARRVPASPGSELRHRGRGRSPPMATASVASSAAPRGGYAEEIYHDAPAEDDEEVVLTCTDCMMPIRDENTPQFCPETGLRHY